MGGRRQWHGRQYQLLRESRHRFGGPSPLHLPPRWRSPDSPPPSPPQLFVGLTAFLLGFFWILVLLKKSDDRGFLIINLGLTGLYWIFWLSAAAASADTVSWVNSWPSVPDGACENIALVGYGYSYYCGAGSKKGAVRSVCAFSWLTWALITASLVFIILEDVMRKKALNSKPAAADADAAPEAAKPGTEAVAAAAEVVPEAAAKV